VYLSGVCAETPLVLRACAPGELGAVISRYDGVRGYDWVAIPLITLHCMRSSGRGYSALRRFEDGQFLRDQYRRAHLEVSLRIAATEKLRAGTGMSLWLPAMTGRPYAFQIETTPAQDQAFIRQYNSSPNRSHFRTVSHNCADFAKDVINFYYPKTLHRSIVADIGITTPKQMAKTLIKFSERHPQLQFSRFVIPQVPGSVARSTPVHGVVESFFKSKKYIVPSAVASPDLCGLRGGGLFGTGAGHSIREAGVGFQRQQRSRTSSRG